jgi:hypothetical protein
MCKVHFFQYKGLLLSSVVFMGHVATTLSSHINFPSEVPKPDDLDKNNLGASFGDRNQHICHTQHQTTFSMHTGKGREQETDHYDARLTLSFCGSPFHILLFLLCDRRSRD